ncbi:MAG TPA: DNA cytosine methyltransferase [Magnetospirillum sp.]|nr:DNA cytosine methyltransferase [Magnetospirillum sp.]
MTTLRQPVVRCIDLFCGAGGLTVGLQKAGIEVVLGVDADPACSFPYEENTGSRFLHGDVRKLKAKKLKDALKGADWTILAGCAPCQPFSTYTSGRLNEDDERWGLLASFARLVKEVKPDIVTMENVWKLERHEVFSDFLISLKSNGYQPAWKVIDCTRVGVPQRRKRLVLIASRHGKPSLPEEQDGALAPKVIDVIGGLPKIAAGGTDPKDPIHVASSLSETNLKRIKASRPGGTWRDWPEDLRATCHTKKSGRTYPSVYGRMRWDEPAPTITGQCYGFGNGRFGHPEQHRALSLREAALLQTFPPDFVFVAPGKPVHMKVIGQMIGNAVPPRLGEVIGLSIMKELGGGSSQDN